MLFRSNLDDARVILQARHVRMQMYLAPAFGIIHLLIGCDGLIAKKDHAMIEYRAMRGIEGVLVHLARKINTTDLRAQAAGKGLDADLPVVDGVHSSLLNRKDMAL